MTSSPIQFLWKLNTNDQGYIKATYRITFWSDIRLRELKYKVGKLTENKKEKNGYKVTNFNRVLASAVSNHLRKPCPNRFICSAGILFTRKPDTLTDTQINCSENITPQKKKKKQKKKQTKKQANKQKN